MSRFSFAEQEFIADVATALKWKVEEDVEAGKPFDQARAARIKQAEVAWTGLTPDMAQAVRGVCWSIDLPDLSPRTHRAVKDRVRTLIEAHRGRPLGRIERALYNLTGMTF